MPLNRQFTEFMPHANNTCNGSILKFFIKTATFKQKNTSCAITLCFLPNALFLLWPSDFTINHKKKKNTLMSEILFSTFAKRNQGLMGEVYCQTTHLKIFNSAAVNIDITFIEKKVIFLSLWTFHHTQFISSFKSV